MEGFSNQEQLLLFLQSILLGAGCGAVYDLLRAPRRVFRFGRAATAVCDACFWLVVLCALFEFQLLFAAGQDRYFVLAGAAIGAAVYFSLLSALLLTVLETGWRAAAWGAQMLRIAARAAYCFWKRYAPLGKIQEFAKKFAKPSSIFRGKGIK